MTIDFYEFFILINHQDCLNEIAQYRDKLHKKYNFNVSNHKESQIWLLKSEKISLSNDHISLIHLINKWSQEIIFKYQPHNSNKQNFIDSMFWFILTGVELFIDKPSFRVISKINREKREKEVWIKLSRLTTKNDLINYWASIIKPAIDELPIEESQINKTQDFMVHLQIYKCYLRAKCQWKRKSNFFSRLYNSEAMDAILDNIDPEDIPSLDSFKKIIINFKKKYHHLNLISEHELNQLIIEK